MRSLALPVLLLVAACSSSSATSAPAPSSDATSSDVYAGLRLQNDLCLPEPLPTDGAGGVDCRVLAMTTNGASCASIAGASPASSSDTAVIAAVVADAGAAMGTLCEIAQLPGNCTASSASGWCYEAHGCGTNATACDESLCASPSLTAALPAGTHAYLACSHWVDAGR